MQYNSAKEKFISSWGEFGINWGINKTMGQIHGLLLLAPKALCADEVMKDLKISRGNANMNINALVEWGLLQKVEVKGDRKDYFFADKDFWSIFKKIIEQRKQKELDPMVGLLQELSSVDGVCNESKEFCKIVKELSLFSNRADAALNNMIQSKNNWLLGAYMKMVR